MDKQHPTTCHPRHDKPKGISINSLSLLTLCPLRQNEKMTNEPISKTTQIAVSNLFTSDYCLLMTDNCKENEPKRSQFTGSEGVPPALRKALNHFLLLTLWSLCQNKKTQNEPIFKTRKITVTGFTITGYRSVMTHNCPKNKPNQTGSVEKLIDRLKDCQIMG